MFDEDDTTYILDETQWYSITIVSVIILVAMIYPAIDAFYFICKFHCLTHHINKSSKSNSARVIKQLMNICVTLSFICFELHIVCHVLVRLAQHVDGGFGINNRICKMHIVTVNVLYYSGKTALYSFFVIRAYFVFYGTHIPYSKILIYFLILLIFLSQVALTVIWLAYNYPRTHVRHTHGAGNVNGRICVLSEADTGETENKVDDVFIFTLIGSVIDVILANYFE